MKRKIQVTIRDENGNTTFYGQGVIGPNGKVKVPIGKILKAQKEGVKRGKQPLH